MGGIFGGSEDTLLGRVGLVNNLDEPKGWFTKRETVLGTCISFLIISWLCVGARLYARFRIIKDPGWDDLFVVFSLTTMTIGKVSIFLLTNTGLGQHIVLLSLDQIASYLKIFYVANASYSMSTALIKISLLLQYTRLYHPSSALHKTCRFLIWFTALWGTAYSLMAWVPCVPVSSYWEVIYHISVGNVIKQQQPAMRCYAYGSQLVSVFKATYESHAAVNMALDLLVMGLPVPLYFQVGTPLKTKMGLVGILVMGGFVNMFALWRFISMVLHKSCTEPTFDPTWYGAVSIVMAALETSTACICASIPIFWRPMIDSASDLLEQIFQVRAEISVTKEVQVTSQQRFEVSSLSTATSSDSGCSGIGGCGGKSSSTLAVNLSTRIGMGMGRHMQHKGFHELDDDLNKQPTITGSEHQVTQRELEALELSSTRTTSTTTSRSPNITTTTTATTGKKSVRWTSSQQGYYNGDIPAAETDIGRIYMPWAMLDQEGEREGQAKKGGTRRSADGVHSMSDLGLPRIKSFDEWRYAKDAR